MDMSDQRDHAEEAANQAVLEEEAHEEAKELEEEVEAPVDTTLPQLIQITATWTIEIELSNYESATEEDAAATGIELPIDTAEKARAMEEYWLKEGFVGIDDLRGDEDVEVKMSLVPNPVHPHYVMGYGEELNPGGMNPDGSIDGMR